MPSVSLVDDVFRLKARGLLVAGFASAVMLAWFGTLMYLVERNDNEVEVRAQACLHCYRAMYWQLQPVSWTGLLPSVLTVCWFCFPTYYCTCRLLVIFSGHGLEYDNEV